MHGRNRIGYSRSAAISNDAYYHKIQWRNQSKRRISRKRQRYTTKKSYFCAPCYGVWRSPVAHYFGVVGVAGSNPVTPTNDKF